MWTASVLERISTKFVHLKSLLELGLEHRAIRNSTPHGTEPTVISVQAHSEPTAELDCVTNAQPSGNGTQGGDIGGGVGEVVSLKSNSSCNPCFDELKADSPPELTNRSLARGLGLPLSEWHQTHARRMCQYSLRSTGGSPSRIEGRKPKEKGAWRLSKHRGKSKWRVSVCSSSLSRCLG